MKHYGPDEVQLIKDNAALGRDVFSLLDKIERLEAEVERLKLTVATRNALPDLLDLLERADHILRGVMETGEGVRQETVEQWCAKSKEILEVSDG